MASAALLRASWSNLWRVWAQPKPDPDSFLAGPFIASESPCVCAQMVCLTGLRAGPGSGSQEQASCECKRMLPWVADRQLTLPHPLSSLSLLSPSSSQEGLLAGASAASKTTRASPPQKGCNITHFVRLVCSSVNKQNARCFSIVATRYHPRRAKTR